MPRRTETDSALFVGQIWKHPVDDKHATEQRFVVCSVIQPARDAIRPHLRCSLLSLSHERWAFGIRGNGIHSEAILREDGYVPDGFMSAEKVRGIEDTRRARMPQHVIDTLRDSKARKWAAMEAEQNGGEETDVNFATAETLAKIAEDAEQSHRSKVWRAAKRMVPGLVKAHDVKLENLTGMVPELPTRTGHRRN